MFDAPVNIPNREHDWAVTIHNTLHTVYECSQTCTQTHTWYQNHALESLGEAFNIDKLLELSFKS